jgi:hypothetical protein
VTKWVEAKALYSANEQYVVDFIFEDIFTHFGVPREIVIEQGTQFTSNLVKSITEQYHIKHRKSSPYHPQVNGQVESTNKVIEAKLTKTVWLHHKDWVDQLPAALWAYRTTWRNTTCHTPYELVYGKQVFLPIEFQVKTFRTVMQLGMDLDEAKKQRILQLNELDEIRQDDLQRTTLIQEQRTKWHHKYIKKKYFHPGDWAMLYGSRFKHFKGKLSTRWLGPYEVETVYENGSVKIKTIDEDQTSFIVNGHRLKVYHKPLSKEDFIKQVLQNSEMQLVSKRSCPPVDPPL